MKHFFLSLIFVLICASSFSQTEKVTFFYENRGMYTALHRGPHCPYVIDKKIELEETSEVKPGADLCRYCVKQEVYHQSTLYIPRYHSSIHIFDLSSMTMDSICSIQKDVDLSSSDGSVKISISNDIVTDSLITAIKEDRKQQRFMSFAIGMGAVLAFSGQVTNAVSNDFNTRINALNLEMIGLDIMNMAAYNQIISTRKGEVNSLGILVTIQNTSSKEVQLSNSLTGQLYYLLPGETKQIYEPDYIMCKYRSQQLGVPDAKAYHYWINAKNYLFAREPVYQDIEKYIFKSEPFKSKHYISKDEDDDDNSEYYKVMKNNLEFVEISKEDYDRYRKLKKVEIEYE